MKTDAAKQRLRNHVVLAEIDQDWYKLVQAEPSRTGGHVSKIHAERYTSAGNLAKAFPDACHRSNLAHVPVILSIPRHRANIKILEFPSTDADEIADMADLQVGKQTPYSREEIVYDYKILGGGRDGYTKVMMVIVQSSTVREYASLLEDAGYSVERTSVTTEGLMAFYANSEAATLAAGAPVILLDIDAGYSDFCVIARGSLSFTRSITVGGTLLTEGLGTYGGRFVDEVLQAMEICQNEVTGVVPAKLLLTGACAGLAGLAALLSERLRLPVVPVSMGSGIKKLPSLPDFATPPHNMISMAPLMGMVQAPDSLELDLTPETLKLRKRLVAKARSMTLLGTMLMTALCFASIYIGLKLCIKESLLQALRRRKAQIQAPVSQVLGMKSVLREVKKRQRSELDAVMLIRRIHELLPKDDTIALDSYVMDASDVEKVTLLLGGSGRKMDDVINFCRTVDASGDFQAGQETTTRDSKTDRYNFSIPCIVEMKQESKTPDAR